jgi:uncharacterized membrane protein
MLTKNPTRECVVFGLYVNLYKQYIVHFLTGPRHTINMKMFIDALLFIVTYSLLLGPLIIAVVLYVYSSYFKAHPLYACALFVIPFAIAIVSFLIGFGLSNLICVHDVMNPSQPKCTLFGSDVDVIGFTFAPIFLMLAAPFYILVAILMVGISAIKTVFTNM